MGTTKTPAKAKEAAKEGAAQKQSTGTTTAAAAAAPGVEQSGQQNQPNDGGQSNGEAAHAGSPAADGPIAPTDQAVKLVRPQSVGEDGKSIIAADQAKELEPIAGEVSGKSGSVIFDEYFRHAEPWEGLQRAASDVAIERLRQVADEGFTLEWDDQSTNGQLARAASCYLVAAAGLPAVRARLNWPFDQKWFKPGLNRDNLVKAGALILAEIERLDRAEAAV